MNGQIDRKIDTEIDGQMDNNHKTLYTCNINLKHFLTLGEESFLFWTLSFLYNQ